MQLRNVFLLNAHFESINGGIHYTEKLHGFLARITKKNQMIYPNMGHGLLRRKCVKVNWNVLFNVLYIYVIVLLILIQSQECYHIPALAW